jgi:acetyltransferase-like isoleucine patch superfamily enzyme
MTNNYTITNKEAVVLGENITIQPYAILGLIAPNQKIGRQKLRIGNNAFIGSHSSIYLNNNIGNNVNLIEQVLILGNNKIGNNCRIGPKSVISHSNKIGNHVRIHSHAFLERVQIENHVFISPHVVFADDIHPPCPKYEECLPEIYVESRVSIGANVIVLPGSKIGHHTQVYAGAVVNGEVEPYSVMAGNPAKKIKDFRELKCDPGFYKYPFEWWDVNEK